MANIVNARLAAILAKVAPKASDYHATTGRWPNRHPEPGVARDPVSDEPLTVDGEPVPLRHSGAPFVFRPGKGGKTELRVTGDEGDVAVGLGTTNGEAVAALFAKLGLEDPKEGS